MENRPNVSGVNEQTEIVVGHAMSVLDQLGVNRCDFSNIQKIMQCFGRILNNRESKKT